MLGVAVEASTYLAVHEANGTVDYSLVHHRITYTIRTLTFRSTPDLTSRHSNEPNNVIYLKNLCIKLLTFFSSKARQDYAIPTPSFAAVLNVTS